jgi:hypothetical protein
MSRLGFLANENIGHKVQYGDFSVPVWVDDSHVLFVEPRLIGDLDVVSVRVADVCREVVGTPIPAEGSVP